MDRKTTKQIPFLIVAFLSGAAGLIYEVLWFREFALRLGNTAEAASLVLAIIFIGLAFGHFLGGRWSRRWRSPLQGYALVESGMAACGFAVLFFRDQAGRFGLPPLFLLLLGIAVLMGATLPLLLQSLSGEAREQRESTARLYGINTLGGMIGACGAGLLFPVWLGIRGSFMVAVSINLFLAITTFWRSKREARVGIASFGHRPVSEELEEKEGVSRHLLFLAVLSGMGTLALEVLCTRMLSLVFQNSVYSFSLILILILFSIAAAAAWTGTLVKKGVSPEHLLWRSLFVVMLSIPAGVWIFFQSSQLETLFKEAHPAAYVIKVVFVSAAILLPTMISAGMILPLCWAVDHKNGADAGWRLGRFLMWNTVGGVIGSIGAGFFLLPVFGLWPSFGVIALCYAGGAVLVLYRLTEMKNRRRRLIFTTAGWVLPSLLLWPFLSTQHLDPGEVLLHLSQNAEAQVAVIQQRSGGRILKVNNTYSLGSSIAEIEERRMGEIPLLLHPHPKSVAFVGLATGITASAIYDHPVEKVTLIELLPEVAKAAAWFEKENRGLLNDPRSELIIADGRIAIPKGKEPFDLIISDLFVPWHAGATSLYSLEYYQKAAERLAPGGLYAQWLPLYQLSSQEFRIIGRTFREAFQHVSLWRGNFSPEYPIVALIGSNRPIPIGRDRLKNRLSDLKSRSDPYLATPDDMMLLFGGGEAQLTRFFQGALINTDNRPYIEYLAPISHILKDRFTGSALAKLYFQAAQDKNDWRNHALAGAHLYQAETAAAKKNPDQRIAALKTANRLVQGSRHLAKIEHALKVAGLMDGMPVLLKNNQ